MSESRPNTAFDEPLDTVYMNKPTLRGLDGRAIEVEKEEDERPPDPDELNPTVVRLTQELKEEKAAARKVKKEYRQNQAELFAARVDIETLTKERDEARSAHSTAHDMALFYEDEMERLNGLRVEADIKASTRQKALNVKDEALTREELVTEKFTKDLIYERSRADTAEKKLKELQKTNTTQKFEIVSVKEKLIAAQAENKKLFADVKVTKVKQKDANDLSFAAAQDSKKWQKIAAGHEADVKRAEKIAIDLKDHLQLIQVDLEKEKETTKKLNKELQVKKLQHATEQEKVIKWMQATKEEQSETLKHKKVKMEVETMLRAVNDQSAVYKKRAEFSETEAEWKQGKISTHVTQIQTLEDEVKESRKVVRRLENSLKAEVEARRKLEDQIVKEKKATLAAEDTIKVWKTKTEIADGISGSVVREISDVRKQLSKTTAYNADVDAIVERLNANINEEHAKFLKSQEVVKTLEEKVRVREQWLEDAKKKQSQAEQLASTNSQSRELADRSAKDSGALVTKVSLELSNTKQELIRTEELVKHLEPSLEKYRLDLEQKEVEYAELKAEKAKVQKELVATKMKVSQANSKIQTQDKKILDVQEDLNITQKKAQTTFAVTDGFKREVVQALKEKQEAQEDCEAAMKMKDAYAERVDKLEAELKEAKEVIEKQKKEALSFKMKTMVVEKGCQQRDVRISNLEESFAKAEGGSHYHDALSKQMALKLAEAKSQVQPLEQEVGCFKISYENLLGDYKKAKAEKATLEESVKSMKKEVEKAKKEALDWQSKVEAPTYEARKMSEAMAAANQKLRDAELNMKMLTSEVKTCKARATTSEVKAAELEANVHSLITQLKAAEADRDAYKAKAKEERKEEKKLAKAEKRQARRGLTGGLSP